MRKSEYKKNVQEQKFAIVKSQKQKEKIENKKSFAKIFNIFVCQGELDGKK